VSYCTDICTVYLHLVISSSPKFNKTALILYIYMGLGIYETGKQASYVSLGTGLSSIYLSSVSHRKTAGNV
jgi:hypothetical protein